MKNMNHNIPSLELCAGAGGQALGMEKAGFEHTCLVEIDHDACSTLKLNRPYWNIIEDDLHEFDARPWKGIDLLSGGFPCPPFSVAGKQMGEKDDRNLFEVGLRIVDQIRPKAVMFENVRGFLDTIFDDYRSRILERLRKLGYKVEWRLLNASDFGVPQLRPRVVIVALKKDIFDYFKWPNEIKTPLTVGETLYDLMAENSWQGARLWADKANDIAPTIVGGSKKHGGPDLGPTRAKRAWASLGVDGHGIAYEAPLPDFCGMPKLTVRMVARIQGFDDSWQLYGKKTSAYRQVGNAFPPPVAQAVSHNIANTLIHSKKAVVVNTSIKKTKTG